MSAETDLHHVAAVFLNPDALAMYVMVLSGWAAREVAFQWWQVRRRDRR